MGGFALVGDMPHEFELALLPAGDGEWRLFGEIRWSSVSAPPVVRHQEAARGLVGAAARLLYTINSWAGEQAAGGGAKMILNEKLVPPDVHCVVSFRRNMLDVPSAPWETLWDRVSRHVAADPFFRVLGFDRQTVTRVLPHIKAVFPNDWVRARFEAAGFSTMAGQLEPNANGWFPAYHLARTAQGAICRDPGWNYLVEIGLALEQLRAFEGLDRLKRQLAKSPGTQHHLCLAAELHKRGLLIGLEPPTGAGTASSDLRVRVANHRVQIEVKEFVSGNPGRRLRKELLDKVKKLPTHLREPVIFHVVLRENGVVRAQRAIEFFETVAALELPREISAVVAGSRFVDSSGGHVKREIGEISVNSQAKLPVDETHLRTVFASTHKHVLYPTYGIGNFFLFR